MCNLLIAIPKTNNLEKLKEIIFAQQDQMKTQKDGIGMMALKKDGTTEIYRSMTDYDGAFDKALSLLKDSKLIALHTRISTGGETSLHNCHFFENNGFVLAHNGWFSKTETSFSAKHNTLWDYDDYYNGYGQMPTLVPSYFKEFDNRKTESIETEYTHLLQKTLNCKQCSDSQAATGHLCKDHKHLESRLEKLELVLDERTSPQTTTGIISAIPKKEKDCDSLATLKKIPENATKEQIQEIIYDEGFSGVAIVTNKKTHESVVFVQKECPVITNDDFVIAFSYSPVDTISYCNTVNSNGFLILKGEKEKKLFRKTESLAFGTHKLNFNYNEKTQSNLGTSDVKKNGKNTNKVSKKSSGTRTNS